MCGDGVALDDLLREGGREWEPGGLRVGAPDLVGVTVACGDLVGLPVACGDLVGVSGTHDPHVEAT